MATPNTNTHTIGTCDRCEDQGVPLVLGWGLCEDCYQQAQPEEMDGLYGEGELETDGCYLGTCEDCGDELSTVGNLCIDCQARRQFIEHGDECLIPKASYAAAERKDAIRILGRQLADTVWQRMEEDCQECLESAVAMGELASTASDAEVRVLLVTTLKAMLARAEQP